MTSKIKVDNIENQCGGAVVTKCGGTTTITGSVVKSNAIQASDGGNLVSQSGTTITLGASGDTINLASGASQSGFGRTGTVDWQTGSIKTSTFTAANGEGYFANTSGGAFTMNLPAGTAGNIVSVVDYTNTFQTNNLTITPNGSQKIGGTNSSATLSTEGQSVTLVYVDDTEGWKNTMDSTSNITGRTFVAATGGTITTSGNCKIHTFTGPGSFCVSAISSVAEENNVSYLVIAGGGANYNGNPVGGGGAGGYREIKNPATPYTASPLDGYSTPANRVAVTVTAFPITVGGGGTPGPSLAAAKGSNSVFSTITSTGGGASGNPAGGPGGSGGGGTQGSHPGGSGNTPPVSPPQGNNGGTGYGGGSDQRGGGGGGAGTVGCSGTCSGNGGNGATSSINATPTTRAGGGGGGTEGNPAGNGGPGGGGNGGQYPSCSSATNGTDNTGGGAGGGYSARKNGGSGIVIIRYKFQ